MEQLGIMTVMGFVLQWAKGPKKVPTWVAYAVFGGIAVAAFAWQTPGIEKLAVQDWRKAVSLLAVFLVGIEGFTATFRKIGIAPKTDSL